MVNYPDPDAHAEYLVVKFHTRKKQNIGCISISCATSNVFPTTCWHCQWHTINDRDDNGDEYSLRSREIVRMCNVTIGIDLHYSDADQHEFFRHLSSTGIVRSWHVSRVRKSEAPARITYSVDFGNTFLHMNVKMTRVDGKDLHADDTVVPTNYFVHDLFSHWTMTRT